MAKKSKWVQPKVMSVEDYGGESFITIRRLKDNKIHLEVGHECVNRVDVVIRVGELCKILDKIALKIKKKDCREPYKPPKVQCLLSSKNPLRHTTLLLAKGSVNKVINLCNCLECRSARILQESKKK